MSSAWGGRRWFSPFSEFSWQVVFRNFGWEVVENGDSSEWIEERLWYVGDVPVGVIALEDQFGLVCASTPIEMGAERFFSEWGSFRLAEVFLIA